MPTVRQRRILDDLGITCWVDRTRAAAARSAAAAAPPPRRAALPEALRALVEEPATVPAASRSRPARAPAPQRAADAAAVAQRLPAALGCLWVPGALLLTEATLTPEDRRFCRDLLLAGAALDTVDRASTSHRARLSAAAKPQWLAIAATDLVGSANEFQGAALGVLRKRIDTAAAQRLLISGGLQGVPAAWLSASDQDVALSDQLDPALAALGARLGQWRDSPQRLPVFVLPPLALLRADPQRKARLWRWLVDTACE